MPLLLLSALSGSKAMGKNTTVIILIAIGVALFLWWNNNRKNVAACIAAGTLPLCGVSQSAIKPINPLPAAGTF